MPLWLVSCQRRNEEKMASRRSIIPSPLPPFAGLSYSARARKPFLISPLGGGGCGAALPNNSVALSIVPLPFLSSTSHASSVFVAVHAVRIIVPLPSSKLTPLTASVRSKPLPWTSIRIGVQQFPLPSLQYAPPRA